MLTPRLWGSHRHPGQPPRSNGITPHRRGQSRGRRIRPRLSNRACGAVTGRRLYSDALPNRSPHRCGPSFASDGAAPHPSSSGVCGCEKVEVRAGVLQSFFPGPLRHQARPPG
jgi:hypothetical protein